MVKKVEGLEAYGFDIKKYQQRLKLMRQIVSGENQQDFAARIGVDQKRWNNYEQGYPIPRHVAMMLISKLDGMSVEWLWFGKEGNLSADYRDRIRTAETLQNRLEAKINGAAKALPRGKSKAKKIVKKRKKRS